MGENGEQTRLWTKDFILAAIINFLLFSSWQMFPFVLPIYLQDMGTPDVALGWITAITTVAALLIRPFCGALLDRFGRKGVLLAGIALMIVSVAAYAVFSTVLAIFLIRFTHGLSWGVASTSSQTVASDVIPPKRFGEGMGFFALSASLALALAPGLSLALFDLHGMAAAAFAACGMLACALLLGARMKYRTIETGRTPDKHLFERSSVLPAAIVFCLTMCYGALTTFLALHAAAQGIGDIGGFFVAYAAAVALSRPLLGKVVDRKGYGAIIVPGLASMVVSLAVLSVADSSFALIAVALLYGAGFAACNSTLQTMAVAGVPADRRGAANATYLVGFDSGIGVGGIVSGLIVACVGMPGMYRAFAALPVIAGVLFVLFARKRKPPALQQEADPVG